MNVGACCTHSLLPARLLLRPRRGLCATSGTPLAQATLASSVRCYNTIQRGHDRQLESLYEKLGFGTDSEAHRVRRTVEELQQGFMREALKLKDPENDPKDRTRLAELKQALGLLQNDVFRHQYGSHYYSSNDATLHVLQDGGQVSATFNPEHQTFTFIDHSVPAGAMASSSGASLGGAQRSFGDFRDAYKNATGVGSGASAEARAYSAAEARGPVTGGSVPFLLKISFEESVLGCSSVIDIHRNVKCDRCGGQGTQKLRTPRKCPQCLGRGSAVLPSATYHIERRCNFCAGEGTMPPPACRECKGRGVLEGQPTQIPVVVPPGTASMTMFRLEKKGHDGVRGGCAGDLVLTVMVTEHRYFHRTQDGCLHAMLPVPLSTALLGGLVSVPTLQGPALLRVPPCVRNGQVLAFADHRADAVGETVGGCNTPSDPLLFHLLVLIPKADTLTGRQKEALRSYEGGNEEQLVTEACANHDISSQAAKSEEGGYASRLSEDETGREERMTQSATMKRLYNHWFSV